MTPESYCARHGLPQAGRRSARLAMLIFRLGLRTGLRRTMGLPCEHILRRMPAISRAYLNALESERA